MLSFLIDTYRLYQRLRNWRVFLRLQKIATGFVNTLDVIVRDLFA